VLGACAVPAFNDLGRTKSGQTRFQAAITRGVGIGVLGATFGIISSLVAGGNSVRNTIIPAMMGAAFWGTLVGLTVYFEGKGDTVNGRMV